MLDLIIILYAIVLVLAIATLFIDTGGRLIASPLALVCFLEITAVWPGLLYGWEDGWVVHVATPMIFLVATGSLVLGAWIARSSSELPENAAVYYQRAKPVIVAPERVILFCWLACAVMIAGMIFVHRGLPENITGALTAPFKQAIQDSIHSRFVASKSAYFGGAYRGQGFFRTINLLMSYSICAMSAQLLFKYGLRYLAHIAAFFAIIFIVAMSGGTRGDIVVIAIAGGIAMSFTFYVRLRQILLAFLVMGLVLTGITAMQGRFRATRDDPQNLTTSRVVTQLAFRILAGNSIHTVETIELAQNKVLDYPFAHFHTIAALNSIPASHKNPMTLPFILNRYLHPNSLRTTTFNSPTYLAMCYVDFGVFGVFVIFLLYGFALVQLQHFFFRLQKSPDNLAYFVMLSMAFVNFDLGSGPVGLAVDGGMATLAYLCIRGIVRSGRPLAKRAETNSISAA